MIESAIEPEEIMRKSTGVIAIVALIMGAVLSAAQQAKAAESVAGTWEITVPESPHGKLTMGMTLKQDGKNVSGTFASPHGDMPVTGELIDKNLTLATAGGEITFTAKLTDPDTLSGFLSSAMGDMKWTAKRVKDTQ
jgi:hypothetical protein